LHVQVSNHIRLTPLDVSDAAVIFALVNTNRIGLSEFLYWVKDVKCIYSARKYISERVHSGLNGAHWFKIQFNDNVSGVFAIKSVCPSTFVAEIGYWLCGSAHGCGIIHQIVGNFLKIVPKEGVSAIEFRCLEHNHASINVALKSGATLVDSIPKFMVANGVKQDLNIYRLQL